MKLMKPSLLKLPLLLLLWVCLAHGQALQLPPPPHAEWKFHVGAPVPLDTMLQDEQGKPVRLRQMFHGKPVVLVPGYFRCQTLCSTVFDDAVHSLALANMPPDAYELVWFSIDPNEDATLAAKKKRAYGTVFPGKDQRLHLLTASEAAIHALTTAIGFDYSPEQDSDQFAHPAGFVIVTPQGKVSRYFTGVQYSPRDVATAITSAAREETAQDEPKPSLAQQFFLMCSHYNPVAGRYNSTVMTGLRVIFITAFVVLLNWMLRRRRKKRSNARLRQVVSSEEHRRHG